MKKLEQPIIPATLQLLLKSGKGSKDMYNALNKNTETPTSKQKWNPYMNLILITGNLSINNHL